MPLIDSRHKIMLGEVNPEKRRCQYLFCQSLGKHRACFKCKYVRYCVSPFTPCTIKVLNTQS